MRSLAPICIAAALVGSGCFRHIMEVSGTTPAAEPSYDAWHSHFILGLVDGAEPVQLRAACPQGVARIESYLSAGGAILTVITLGIWSPFTVQVYCDSIIVTPVTTAPPPIMVPIPEPQPQPQPQPPPQPVNPPSVP